MAELQATLDELDFSSLGEAIAQYRAWWDALGADGWHPLWFPCFGDKSGELAVLQLEPDRPADYTLGACAGPEPAVAGAHHRRSDAERPNAAYVVCDASVPGSQTPTGASYGSIEAGVGSQASIYFIKTTNGGQTWSLPARIDTQPVPFSNRWLAANPPGSERCGPGAGQFANATSRSRRLQLHRLCRRQRAQLPERGRARPEHLRLGHGRLIKPAAGQGTAPPPLPRSIHARGYDHAVHAHGEGLR